MAYADLLLTALTYPDATPERAIRSGVALAKRIGGGLTFLAVRADLPKLRNPLANALIHLDQMSELEQARSAATAQLETTCARIAADLAGKPIRTESLTARLYEETEVLARVARTHDLTLVPIGSAVLADRAVAEAILFGSGRPVLVYPEAAEIAPADDLGTIVIAWDGGAAAARAVADALPLLTRAFEVRIFVALGEKPQTHPDTARDLVRHLATHGVDAKVDAGHDKGRSIGPRLNDYVASKQPDLLVMGGFGHARLREFVLGGATDAMLQAPPCPVLMSH